MFGVVLCVVCFTEVYSASDVVLEVVIGLVEAAVGSSTFSSAKSKIIVLYALDLLPILFYSLLLIANGRSPYLGVVAATISYTFLKVSLRLSFV